MIKLTEPVTNAPGIRLGRILNVNIPFNSNAGIKLPTTTEVQVTTAPAEAKLFAVSDARVVYELPLGHYQFEFK